MLRYIFDICNKYLKYYTKKEESTTLKVLSIHFMIRSKTFIKYLLSASTVHASDQVGDSSEIYGPVLGELLT